MATEFELAEAFAPCTEEGLADELWTLYVKNNEIQASIEAIRRILLDKSVADHNNADEPFRLGRIIKGKNAEWQAVWRHKGDCLHTDIHIKCWNPRLEKVRRDKRSD